MSINSTSLFELLTCIAHLSENLRFCANAFTITHLPEYFSNSTTTWVVEIDVIPILHMSAQNYPYVYFAIIAYYLDIVEFLLGVTGSSI